MKKSLTITLRMVFKIFRGSQSEPQKKWKKFLKMGTFFGKIPKHVHSFFEKLPQGPELLAAHPRPIQKLRTPLRNYTIIDTDLKNVSVTRNCLMQNY